MLKQAERGQVICSSVVFQSRFLIPNPLPLMRWQITGPGQFPSVAMTSRDIYCLRVEEILNWLLTLRVSGTHGVLPTSEVLLCSQFLSVAFPVKDISFLSNLTLSCCSGGSFLLQPWVTRESSHSFQSSCIWRLLSSCPVGIACPDKTRQTSSFSFFQKSHFIVSHRLPSPLPCNGFLIKCRMRFLACSMHCP